MDAPAEAHHRGREPLADRGAEQRTYVRREVAVAAERVEVRHQQGWLFRGRLRVVPRLLVNIRGLMLNLHQPLD